MAEERVATRPRKRRAAPPPRDEQPDTPDPIEIAMAAVATGADRHGAARAVLEKHARLIDVQCEREREELSVLKLQRLTRWLILAAVIALLLGLASAVWVAGRSKSLVIEPFEVPPSLAQNGLNGRVVSARVLDQLAELQRSTESMRGEKSYADNWQDDIKLAIPDTGISLGEAWRTLKSWLGQETRIGGEIFRTPTGLAISTRAGPLSGGTIAGSDGDVDRLIREAALSIYKVTQPYRYAISLPEDRVADTMQMLNRLTGDPSEMERKWAYSGLSVMYRTQGDLQRSLTMARRALAIDPDLLPALGNLVHAQYRLGREQAAVDAVGRFEAAFDRAPEGVYDPRISRANLINTQELRALMVRDPAAAERYAEEMEKLGSTSSFAADAGLFRAEAATMRHDHRRAAGLIGRLGESLGAEQAPTLGYAAALAGLKRASDLRDPAGIPASIAALRAASLRVPGGENPQTYRLLRLADLAIAYGRAGMASEAGSIAAGLPGDCYDCLRARAWAALAKGDGAGAGRWLREAIGQAPSLAPAYADSAEVALRSGDSSRALDLAKQAARLAPNWADPPKLAGDALVASGRIEQAEREYQAGAALAPNWGLLHLQWANALWRLGRRDEARQKLGAAAAMDLGPGERALLTRMQGKAGRTG